MQKILIIGAGGMGREVLEQLLDEPSYDKAWIVKGFLDNRLTILDGTACKASIVGDPLSYQPEPDDFFICAIGAPRARQQYAKPLLEKGAKFFSIGTSLYDHTSTRIAEGCMFGYAVRIGADSRIGRFTSIQVQTVIGHDARIGEYVQIGAMAFLGGGVQIGDFAMIHPHATIIPGIKIGTGATVGAGAVVVKDVPAGATVFGNPAKIIFQG